MASPARTITILFTDSHRRLPPLIPRNRRRTDRRRAADWRHHEAIRPLPSGARLSHGRDTLHLVSGGLAVLLLLFIIGVASTALGASFRLFSLATAAILVGFGAWAGLDGSRVADDLATPWLGVKERISFFAYQVWLTVFAAELLRRHLRQQEPS